MSDSNSLDDALSRIATILGGTPAPPTTPPVPGPISVTPASNAGSTTATVPVPASVLSDSQKEEIARLIYYCMSMPAVTPDALATMEDGLPDVVALLHSLNARPSAKNQFLQVIDAVVSQHSVAERSDGDARIEAFAQALSRDAFGEGDRIVPLIGLGVACFMAAYTVVHNWKA